MTNPTCTRCHGEPHEGLIAVWCAEQRAYLFTCPAGLTDEERAMEEVRVEVEESPQNA